MKTIYLAGPIVGCTDAEVHDWRGRVKKLWPGDTLDPMRRDYRGRQAGNEAEIVRLDLIDIAQSDGLLVNFDKPSVGTSMEVYIAHQAGKPVVVVAPADVVISPWLYHYSDGIVRTYETAVDLLRRLLRC